MKNENPCYNCNERTIECHCTCEKYKTWKIEYINDKRKIESARIADQRKCKIFTLQELKKMQRLKFYDNIKSRCKR